LNTEWLVVPLEELCDRITVGHVGQMVDEYVDQGIPFLRSQNILPFQITTDNLKFIPLSFHKKLRKSALRPGDVAVIRTGYPGTAAVIPQWLNDANCADLVVITPGRKLDAFFLAAVFNSTWGIASVGGRLVGSAQQHFNVGAARRLELHVPPLPTQRKIAYVLSAYDGLIENNNRRIKLLEEMAQRIYREWFVDFRYPGHENVPLVDSEMGPIPQGWNVSRLGDAVEFVYGKALKADARRDGVVTVFGSGGAIGHHDSGLAEGPGIIVGRKGNVGSVYWSDGAFFAIDTTYWIRTRLALTYCYYALRDMDFLDSHAAVPGLSREQAYSLPLIVPEANIVATFNSFVLELFSLRRRLWDTTGGLRATRDLLLPRLISGEIDVTDLNIAMPPEAAT
jgi:type I restriction enzyme, S subunit